MIVLPLYAGINVGVPAARPFRRSEHRRRAGDQQGYRRRASRLGRAAAKGRHRIAVRTPASRRHERARPHSRCCGSVNRSSKHAATGLTSDSQLPRWATWIRLSDILHEYLQTLQCVVRVPSHSGLVSAVNRRSLSSANRLLRQVHWHRFRHHAWMVSTSAEAKRCALALNGRPERFLCLGDVLYSRPQILIIASDPLSQNSRIIRISHFPGRPPSAAMDSQCPSCRVVFLRSFGF